ncbi:MAG: hypothetical protein BAJALOKI1v1_1240005 [Promethearchaeota archaeon]|nr:MAG: hypothetical protein BAJALOKI1v1_1240005 [Candidatus Lokiarchaeota archaeon]
MVSYPVGLKTMYENYSDFMVFRLKDSGERIQLDITEQEFIKDNAHAVLQDSEVIIIVKEPIRRIYIWKGIESSVRKKFIGSRVAATLQRELVKNAHFHRCKVVSIDQGDELKEFLKHFNLKKSEKKKPAIKKEQEKQVYKYTPKSKPLSSSYGAQLRDAMLVNKQPKGVGRVSVITPLSTSACTSTPASIHPATQRSATFQNNEQVLDKILQKDAPSGFKRKHILIGNPLLYGLVEKTAKVFGKEIQEQKWEPFRKFEKELLEMKDLSLRIFVDTKTSAIEAIEVLENLRESPQTQMNEEKAKQREAEKKTEEEDEEEKERTPDKEKQKEEEKQEKHKEEPQQEANEELEEEKEREQEIEQEASQAFQYHFHKWTVNYLREYCKEHDIEIPSGSKKDDIVDLIKESL